jgi:hypothetical protein
MVFANTDTYPYSVDIATAYTTRVDGNVDIVLLELLERYLLALEGAPVLDVSDSEGVGGLGVRHFGGCEALKKKCFEELRVGRGLVLCRVQRGI